MYREVKWFVENEVEDLDSWDRANQLHSLLLPQLYLSPKESKYLTEEFEIQRGVKKRMPVGIPQNKTHSWVGLNRRSAVTVLFENKAAMEPRKVNHVFRNTFGKSSTLPKLKFIKDSEKCGAILPLCVAYKVSFLYLRDT